MQGGHAPKRGVKTNTANAVLEPPFDRQTPFLGRIPRKNANAQGTRENEFAFHFPTSRENIEANLFCTENKLREHRKVT